MKLILASASPRRAQILRDAGIDFEILPTGVHEARARGEGPESMTQRLAEAKAQAAVIKLGRLQEPAIVIAADTVVELEGQAFGKPDSAEMARDMLRRLSGKTHRVITGIAVVRLPDGLARIETECTTVRFATLTPEEVSEYVQTGEPLDKAGAYAIQGFGGRFIERIEGCYFNVVGLPLTRLYRLLVNLGWRARPSYSGGTELEHSQGLERYTK
jgi:nucleoside triphosphate pyrophosphatase